MAAFLHFKPKHIFTGNRENIQQQNLAAVKERSFINLNKVPPAYTSWETSSETKGMGTMKEHRRAFLGSNFQTLIVQS